jgi:hypothetical protein
MLNLPPQPKSSQQNRAASHHTTILRIRPAHQYYLSRAPRPRSEILDPFGAAEAVPTAFPRYVPSAAATHSQVDKLNPGASVTAQLYFLYSAGNGDWLRCPKPV